MQRIQYMIIALCVSMLGTTMTFAQNTDSLSSKTGYKGITFEVQKGKTLRLGFTNQIWVRYTQANPGTTVYGDPQKNIFDIGLRRTRIVLTGSPHDKVHMFMQMGMNNFNYISQRNAGFYFHDAVADYELTPALAIGGGLTAWGGFSRFSSPSIGSLLGVDAPLFAQATNSATDQFLRKLSVYAKGDIQQFSYSVAVSKPMAIQQSSLFQDISTTSSFSDDASNPQFHGYFQYAFFEKEAHKTPYYKGTHLGKKKIFNLGAGFLFQQDAMHRLNESNDTIETALAIFSADAFYESPTSKGGVINVYAAYYNYNFGRNYIRNVGAMNPANGNEDATILNGGGSAYPQVGTGQMGYIQGGYLFPIKEGAKTKYMPYAACYLADFEAVDEAMIHYDLGINVLLNGHRTKLTLAYQNRPVFQLDNNKYVVSERKGLWVAQFQLSI